MAVLAERGFPALLGIESERLESRVGQPRLRRDRLEARIHLHQLVRVQLPQVDVFAEFGGRGSPLDQVEVPLAPIGRRGDRLLDFGGVLVLVPDRLGNDGEEVLVLGLLRREGLLQHVDGVDVETLEHPPLHLLGPLAARVKAGAVDVRRHEIVVSQDVDHLVAELVDVLADFGHVVFRDGKLFGLLLFGGDVPSHDTLHDVAEPLVCEHLSLRLDHFVEDPLPRALAAKEPQNGLGRRHDVKWRRYCGARLKVVDPQFGARKLPLGV